MFHHSQLPATPLRRHEAGDDERRVRGERRRDHRRAGEPPRDLRPEMKYSSRLSPPFLREGEADARRQQRSSATTMAQSIAVRFMELELEERWMHVLTDITASASCSATRAPIFVLLRVGFTRLLSRMMKTSSFGSIQIDVPVKPVWPNASSGMRWPAEFVTVGLLPPERAIVRLCRVVNCRDRRRGNDARPSIMPPLRYMRREARDVVRGAEQSRVRRHAAEVVGTLVVHHAANKRRRCTESYSVGAMRG